jgi:hypothetical protein
MENQTQIVELTQAETEQVEGGFFFVLLAFDVGILAYDAYKLSR